MQFTNNNFICQKKKKSYQANLTVDEFLPIQAILILKLFWILKSYDISIVIWYY